MAPERAGGADITALAECLDRASARLLAGVSDAARMEHVGWVHRAYPPYPAHRFRQGSGVFDPRRYAGLSLLVGRSAVGIGRRNHITDDK